jgi:glycosyl transferase family 25
MKTYKVYYINLDKSTERRDFMEQQFREFKVPITRFTGIYGKELPTEFLKKAKKQHNILTHFPYLNDGEIGLTKTYFELWKIISIQEEDFAIILEDDALISKDFFKDLEILLDSISSNDFIDISGRKGFFTLEKNTYLTKFTIPALQTTGQIIGKEAAKKLFRNINIFYSPIDVIKQDIFKHKVTIFTTNKNYISSNDKNIGGTTIQQKNLPKLKKILRELIRPFWQLLALFTYKFQRCIRNYLFYKKV